MHTQELADWLLTEFEPRPLKPATVDDTLRKLRNLAKCGLDVDAFLASAATAREVAKPVLAMKARLEGSALRDYQVVLNRLVSWKAAKDPAWKVVRYKLAPEPKSRRPIQEPAQVAALEGYRGRDRYETGRRRALMWMVRATRLRRGEHSRMTVHDLRPDYDPSFGAILVPLPGKRGRARAIPLPDSAWDQDGPLQAWLRMRRPDKANPAALWTRRDGLVFRALSPSDMSVEMNAISKELGFRVSFNRLRRFEFTRLKKAQVAPWVLLALHGGSSYRVLEHYLGELTPDEVHAGLVGHVPEFPVGVVPVSGQEVAKLASRLHVNVPAIGAHGSGHVHGGLGPRAPHVQAPRVGMGTGHTRPTP